MTPYLSGVVWLHNSEIHFFFREFVENEREGTRKLNFPLFSYSIILRGYKTLDVSQDEGGHRKKKMGRSWTKGLKNRRT